MKCDFCHDNITDHSKAVDLTVTAIPRLAHYHHIHPACAERIASRLERQADWVRATSNLRVDPRHEDQGVAAF